MLRCKDVCRKPRPAFTCRVTFSDLVRWRDRRTVSVCSPWQPDGDKQCAMTCERYVSPAEGWDSVEVRGTVVVVLMDELKSVTDDLICFVLAVKRFREPVGIRRPWRIWSEMIYSLLLHHPVLHLYIYHTCTHDYSLLTYRKCWFNLDFLHISVSFLGFLPLNCLEIHF